jgi:pimeloyl-ACP methyl ester carboxylesterase
MAGLAYACGLELEQQDEASCVDQFYQAARLAWPHVEQQRAEGRCGDDSVEIYHSALRKLISTGQRFGRFDPRRGLCIQDADGWIHVPTVHQGFPQRADEFDELVPVGKYWAKDLNHYYQRGGLGVTAVAIHHRSQNEPFRPERQIFAATAVLRPLGATQTLRMPFALELHNPLTTSNVNLAGRAVPLAYDFTAPLAFRLKGESRDYVNAFLRPGYTTSNRGLLMIEPYQPGKFPIVLVHGLLSDPFTWANIANEIFARPDLREQFQIWVFEYATGDPFLVSAAELRAQLVALQSQVDPLGMDPALRKTVLVGHSMGGLVAKLQITHSGDDLWRSISNSPLDYLKTSPTTYERLATSFFFDPSPQVSRVVFIGTPHRGSPLARRRIGRLSSWLVEEPSVRQQRHAQLIRDNPGVFSPEFTRRTPTSIDLLESSSPLLLAIDQLPIASHVETHTIFGNYRPMLGGGPSDGVVPVASARHPSAVTERMVRSKHTDLHQHDEGINELLGILRRHAGKK